MSKIGKSAIILKTGINALVEGSKVKISGPKGQFEYQIPAGFEVTVADGKVLIVPKKSNISKNKSAMYGLVRASLANMIGGVESEFVKKLVLSGVGYKAQIQGTDLVLSLGFSHQVRFKPKAGVKIAVVENAVVISGIDKSLVGEAAANIRAVKPPEPYKGKGIKYDGEHLRRKAGKAAKAAGAK